MTTNDERLAEVRRVAAMIEASAFSDAQRMDATPFDQAGVGEMLGGMLAMTAALARLVAMLAGDERDNDDDR
jgi:hypothetical protein